MRLGRIPVVGIAVVMDSCGTVERTPCFGMLISGIFIGQRDLFDVPFMKMPVFVELDARAVHGVFLSSCRIGFE